VWHILELGGGGGGGTGLRREDCDSGQRGTADCGIQRVARFHPFEEKIYTVTVSIRRGKKTTMIFPSSRPIFWSRLKRQFLRVFHSLERPALLKRGNEKSVAVAVE